MDQQVICFGESLWDMLPNTLMPGGAPMNVATHLKYSGFSPVLISRVGNDALGKELIDVLKKKGIDIRFIQIDEIHPTSVVKANLDNNREITYEIASSVAWDYITFDEQIAQIVAQSDLFIYGSLASRNKTTYNTLLKYLSLAKVKVLDINLRPPHYSPKLIQQLLNWADIVKMNDRELVEVMSWFGKIAPEKEAMEYINSRFNVRTLLISRGQKGAILLNEDSYFEHAGFQVDVVDTIGSGDAFLAAFLGKMIHNVPIQEALEFACATGALVATRSGALPEFTYTEIHNFIQKQNLLRRELL